MTRAQLKTLVRNKITSELLRQNDHQDIWDVVDGLIDSMHVLDEDLYPLGSGNSTGSGLQLGITSTTAHRGDFGNLAYQHSQAAHAPANAERNTIVGIRLNNVVQAIDVDRFVNLVIEASSSETGISIRDKLTALVGEARLDASAIKNLPSATSTETGATIRDKLQTLTGVDRLDASAIKNLPDPVTSLAAEAIVYDEVTTNPVGSALSFATEYDKRASVSGTNATFGPTAFTNVALGRQVDLTLDSKNAGDTFTGPLSLSGTTTTTINGVANTSVRIKQAGSVFVAGAENTVLVEVKSMNPITFEVTIY